MRRSQGRYCEDCGHRLTEGDYDESGTPGECKVCLLDPICHRCQYFKHGHDDEEDSEDAGEFADLRPGLQA